MAFKREPGDDVKTPQPEFLTARERTIVFTSVRIFVKGVVPHLPALAKYGAVAVGFLAMLLQHWAGKIETDKRIKDVAGESEATTKRAYKGLAKPTRDLAAEVAALEARLTAAEATNKAQSALIVAREKDIVIEGRPVRAPRRRVDPGLVKAVQANAAKDSKELAARKAKPAPVITPIPLELPPAPPVAEVPKPATPTAPSAPTVPEWFAPPAKPAEATP